MDAFHCALYISFCRTAKKKNIWGSWGIKSKQKWSAGWFVWVKWSFMWTSWLCSYLNRKKTKILCFHLHFIHLSLQKSCLQEENTQISKNIKTTDCWIDRHHVTKVQYPNEEPGHPRLVSQHDNVCVHLDPKRCVLEYCVVATRSSSLHLSVVLTLWLTGVLSPYC